MSRFGEQRWLALFAAMLGYMLDALDVLLYVFAVQTLRDQFHWSAEKAGLVSSATLITSAFGGVVAGILADRMGRTRTLIYTILLYSILAFHLSDLAVPPRAANGVLLWANEELTDNESHIKMSIERLMKHLSRSAPPIITISSGAGSGKIR